MLVVDGSTAQLLSIGVGMPQFTRAIEAHGLFNRVMFCGLTDTKSSTKATCVLFCKRSSYFIIQAIASTQLFRFCQSHTFLQKSTNKTTQFTKKRHTRSPSRPEQTMDGAASCHGNFLISHSWNTSERAVMQYGPRWRCTARMAWQRRCSNSLESHRAHTA